MIAKIVYIVGVVLAVLGCIDILKSKKITLHTPAYGRSLFNRLRLFIFSVWI